jgi:hypothetical protein
LPCLLISLVLKFIGKGLSAKAEDPWPSEPWVLQAFNSSALTWESHVLTHVKFLEKWTAQRMHHKPNGT